MGVLITDGYRDGAVVTPQRSKLCSVPKSKTAARWSLSLE
jgi:hypothetical protein